MRSVRGLADYLPIAEHGIIGDLHTVALIDTDGTIDWYCCPRFDSPSVFGAILDKRRGGYCRIAPATGQWTPKTAYRKSIKGVIQAPAFLMWNVEKV